MAAVDKHKVIGWSLSGPTKAPLMLRHTKAFTVRRLCPQAACRAKLMMRIHVGLLDCNRAIQAGVADEDEQVIPDRRAKAGTDGDQH